MDIEPIADEIRTLQMEAHMALESAEEQVTRAKEIVALANKYRRVMLVTNILLLPYLVFEIVSLL